MSDNNYDDESWLREQYETLGKSQRQLARECHCDRSTIFSRLVKFKIEIRAKHDNFTIENLRAWAIEQNGECLSVEYNWKEKQLWRCGFGHEWHALWNNIQVGHWCPVCAGQGKPTIEDIKELARERGGACLSEEYINNKLPMTWTCIHGHTWKASYHSAKSGKWCPFCAGVAPHSLVYLQEAASVHGGKCLSETYTGMMKLAMWECKFEHRWKAKPNDVINKGTWCPVCAGVAPHDIEYLQDAARERGGRCISEIYSRMDTKTTWECESGHRWEAIPNSIIHNNSWCPVCSSVQYANESYFRDCLENLFRVKFEKCKPEWLMGEHGRKLELDGYNEALGIAFEYQGIQHFKIKEWFKDTPEKLKRRQQRDMKKAAMTRERGIILLTPSYKLKQNNFIGYIIDELPVEKLEMAYIN